MAKSSDAARDFQRVCEKLKELNSQLEEIENNPSASQDELSLRLELCRKHDELRVEKNHLFAQLEMNIKL